MLPSTTQVEHASRLDQKQSILTYLSIAVSV